MVDNFTLNRSFLIILTNGMPLDLKDILEFQGIFLYLLSFDTLQNHMREAKHSSISRMEKYWASEKLGDLVK